MAEGLSSSSGPGLGRAACLVTGHRGALGERGAARLVAARLAPGSLLLLAACSAGALGELEGELCTAYPELCIQALPADLGTDEGLQRVARDAADALRRHHDSARLQRLLLINNAGERARVTGRRECAGGGRSAGELPPRLRAAAARDPLRSAAPGTGRIAHLPSSPRLRTAQGLGVGAGGRVPGPLASFAGEQPAGWARRDGRSAGEW
ncbi:hypothetical protein JRQ81_017018 [Phrynocephalus forsythii]|uniref:Sepiapterin reductase n=1 Tax=Phrynocephalus forsythii TaxID=171643 RepID=A0A9Q0XWM8_9SAUR|nr:hypothetical protein JRQ81_017018 [Phrynocephalus forsythii]